MDSYGAATEMNIVSRKKKTPATDSYKRSYVN